MDDSQTESQVEVCVVCQECFGDGSPNSTTPCGHRLHTECLLSAAQASDNCPVCRANLYHDDEENHIEIEISAADIGEEAMNSIRREVSRLTSARNRRETEEEEEEEHVINIDETPLLRQSRLTFTIFRMCRTGNLSEVRRIVQENEGMKDAQDEDFDTLLHTGVYSGNEQLLRYLINDLSIPVNSINKYRMTPLHYAVSNSDIGAVTIILNSGAFVDAQDVAGKTPLIYACGQNNSNIAQLLLDRGASTRTFDASGDSPLHYATRGKCISTVKVLLRNGAIDVNATNFIDETPLILSCAASCHTAVRFLLEYGSDPAQTSKSGKKAIDYVPRDNSNTSSRLRHLLSLHTNN